MHQKIKKKNSDIVFLHRNKRLYKYKKCLDVKAPEFIVYEYNKLISYLYNNKNNNKYH